MRSRSAVFVTLVALGGAPVAACMALLPRCAHAATSIELTMTDLVDGSNLVVAGTPLESRSQWEGDASTHGRRIVTYTRLRIDRMIDGGGRPEIWVRTLGGEVDDIGQQVAGEAVLRSGESALLFLHDRTDGTAFVVGMAQGQYLLDTPAQDGTVRVRAPLEGGPLVAKIPSSARPSTPQAASARRSIVGRTLDEIAQLVAAERHAHAP